MLKTINKIKDTYIAYDLKNNENVEIIGTSKDMQEYFNLTQGSFYCAVCRKTKVKHRYLIEKLKEGD